MKRITFAGEELAQQKTLDERTQGIIITDDNCTSQEILDALNSELEKFKNGEHHNPIYYLGKWRIPSGKVYIPLYFHTTSDLQVLKIQSAIHFDASTYYGDVRYAHVYTLRMNIDTTSETIRNILKVETNDIAFGKASSSSFLISSGNTKTYTPTNAYNPATKKYVDEAIANIDLSAIEAPYIITSDNKNTEETLNKVKECWEKFLNNEYYELYVKTSDRMLPLYFMIYGNNTNPSGAGLYSPPYYNTSVQGIGSSNPMVIVRVNLNWDYTNKTIASVGSIESTTKYFSYSDGTSIYPAIFNSYEYLPYKVDHIANKLYVDETNIYDWVKHNIQDWRSGQKYLVDDIVFSHGNYNITDGYYKCLVEHTSSNMNNDNKAGKWVKLTESELQLLEKDPYVIVTLTSTVGTNTCKLNADDEEKVTKLINDFLNSEKNDLYLHFKTKYGTNNETDFSVKIKINKQSLLSKTNYHGYYTTYNPSNSSFVTNYYSCEFRYTITDNVFAIDAGYNITFNFGSIEYAKANKVLTKDNYLSFFPTGDYNPATKLYIDQVAEYDWENNNITLWEMYKNYVAGDIVYEILTGKKKYFKCLRDHKSQNMITNQLDDWQELTGEDLEAIKRPTKEYVDNAIANTGNPGESSATSTNEVINSEAFSIEAPANGDSVSFTLNQDFKDKIVNFINKLLSKNISIGIVTSYCRINFTEYPIQFVICTDYISSNTAISISGTSIPVKFNTDKISVVAHTTLVLMYTYDSETNQITFNYQNNWCMFDNFIATNNTYAYTPTDDYNPATKKYVDEKAGIPLITSKEDLTELINKTKYLRGGNYYSDVIFRYNKNGDSPYTYLMSLLNINLSSLNNTSIGGYSTMYKSGNSIYCRPATMNVTGTLVDDIITINNINSFSSSSETILTNTVVDNKINTAINNTVGDINAVLATLTTVDESEATE